jgi:hypothetical protein
MDLNTFKEYLNIHLISLEQDLDEYSSEDDIGYLETFAAISTTEHFIGVLNER